MKRLMFWPLMAADGEGGGGTGGAGGTGGEGAAGEGAGGTGGSASAQGSGAAGEGAGGTGGDGGSGEEGGGKPYLGEGKPGGSASAQGSGAAGEGGGQATQQIAQPTDEDYAKALAKDEALLGDDKRIQLDAELYKACIPAMKKYGVSPEAANALANALAKAQVEDAKSRMQARLDYFEKMKQESLRTYTAKDFETINAGIDKWFKPGGIMNSVIRNSELGADPEFLALMHYLGKAVAEDAGAGAADGGGAAGGDPNGIDGLSKMW